MRRANGPVSSFQEEILSLSSLYSLRQIKPLKVSQIRKTEGQQLSRLLFSCRLCLPLSLSTGQIALSLAAFGSILGQNWTELLPLLCLLRTLTPHG